MSQQNITTAQNLYAAFGQGDVPAVLAVFDPQIEWVEPEGSPTPGTYRGPQDILEKVLAQFPVVYGPMEIITQDYIDGGDKVVVLGEYRLQDRSGRPVSAPFAHVWDIRDGKFTRYQDYTDTTVMAGAAKQ
ncbi:MAG TPA: nuclear transport factor 2 family protein [Chloroflexia bacterium]|nr:nuclear transport factor 2 family protein [Chloroflexia bacterium]